MPVHLALLDDDDRFRSRLVTRLGFFDEVVVDVESSTPAGFFAALEARDRTPEVALLDIELGSRSGIDVAWTLSERFPRMDILMLTVFDATDTVYDAVRAGASGYLLKDAEAEEIVRGVLDVHAGGAPLSRTVARRVLNSIRLPGRRPAPSHGPDPGLSRRETELLERIVAGETEAVIASALSISPHTVRTHVKNIYRKLQVRSRAAAVRVTIEQGILGRGNS